MEKFPATTIPQSQLRILVQQFDGTMRHAGKSTRHVYKKALDQLLSFVETNIFHFTPDNFVSFRLWLIDQKKLSKNTVNVYLTASRRFCDYLVGIAVLKKNPAWSVHGTAQEFKILKTKLTDIAKAISGINRETILGKRDFAFLSAIFESGASICELIEADVGDLKRDAKDAKLCVKTRAHGKSELISLPESTTFAIDDYMNSRGAVGAGEPLFVTVRGGKAMKSRLSLRGVRYAMHRRMNFGEKKTIRLDSLRTYCAVRLMSRGKSSDEVRSIMRFKSNMPFKKILYNTKAVAGSKV